MIDGGCQITHTARLFAPKMRPWCQSAAAVMLVVLLRKRNTPDSSEIPEYRCSLES